MVQVGLPTLFEYGIEYIDILYIYIYISQTIHVCHRCLQWDIFLKCMYGSTMFMAVPCCMAVGLIKTCPTSIGTPHSCTWLVKLGLFSLHPNRSRCLKGLNIGRHTHTRLWPRGGFVAPVNGSVRPSILEHHRWAERAESTTGR